MANELYRVDNGYGFGSSNGNITASDTLNVSANTINLGSNSNVKITGGSNGQALTTDGAGNLSWVTVGGGGSSNSISTTSATGNITATTYSSSDANTGKDFLGFTSYSYVGSNYIMNQLTTIVEYNTADGSNITTSTELNGGRILLNVDPTYGSGNIELNASNILIGSGGGNVIVNSVNIELGNVANIHITGGNSGEVLSTDGAGNLSWTTVSGGGAANSLNTGANANFTIEALANSTPTNPIVYANIGGQVATLWNMQDLGGGNLVSTFIPGKLTVSYTGVPQSGEIQASTIQFGEYLIAGSSGEVNFEQSPFVGLGPVGNLYITGGNSGEVLSTDGAGNLSWTAVGGGATLPLANGNSNFNIATADGDATVTANNTSTWTFGASGVLTLANGNSTIQSVANSSLDPLNPNVSTMVLTPDQSYNGQALVLDPTAPGHIHLRAPAFSNIDEPSANLFLGGEATSFEITYGANNVAIIHSGGNDWIFSNDGNLTLPGNAVAINFANGSSAFGNIVGTNLDGNASNILYGNGLFAPVVSGYGDSNVVTLLSSFGANTISTTGLITGDGGGLSNVQATSISGTVANANYAAYSGEAYSVSGSNVSGEVANAAYAANANYAAYSGTAFSVDGSNVSGAVANATFATNADVSNSANSVAGSNVSGEVANAAYAANAGYATTSGTSYSVDAANVSGTVANANYAAYSGEAYSVSGSNVSGEVANANYATNANLASYANTAYSVDLANVSGIGNIANINLNGNANTVLYGNGVFAAVSGGGGGGNVIFSTNPNIANANLSISTSYGEYDPGDGNLLYSYNMIGSFTKPDNSPDFIFTGGASQSTFNGPYTTGFSIYASETNIIASNASGAGTVYVYADTSIQLLSANVSLPVPSSITVGTGANAGDVLGYDDSNGRLKWVASGAATSLNTGPGANFTIQKDFSLTSAYANIDGNIITNWVAQQQGPNYYRGMLVNGQLRVYEIPGENQSGQMMAPYVFVQNGLSTDTNVTIDFTSTSNVSLGNVANIHITGGNSGQVLSTDGAGNLSWANAGGGGGGSPAGNTTEIQFNSSGSFAASPDLTLLNIPVTGLGNVLTAKTAQVSKMFIGSVSPRKASYNGASGNVSIAVFDGSSGASFFTIENPASNINMDIPTGNRLQYDIYDGQEIRIRLVGNSSATYNLTWTTTGNDSWREVGVTLPTTIPQSKTIYITSIYNDSALRWDVIDVKTQA